MKQQDAFIMDGSARFNDTNGIEAVGSTNGEDAVEVVADDEAKESEEVMSKNMKMKKDMNEYTGSGRLLCKRRPSGSDYLFRSSFGGAFNICNGCPLLGEKGKNDDFSLV